MKHAGGATGRGALLRDRKVGRAVLGELRARYGTSTTTLKNRIAAFSAAVAPSTAFHSPSSVTAPFSTACISAPVQRFAVGS